MHARNATVKKVDKTLQALSSVTLSVTPNTDHVKREAVSPAISRDNSDDSDGWETDLECEEVTQVCTLKWYYDQKTILFFPLITDPSFKF